MSETNLPAALLTEVEKANQRLREAGQQIADHRVKLVEEAGENEVNLARLEIAIVLMTVVGAKVAIGTPSFEEKEINMLAKLISDRSGAITKEELLKALKSFKTPSGPGE